MRIQHNIPAMSAYRNYTGNVSALSKNLERLSSGYKINRAGDDAAGLAISEKMRAQISGLEQAQANAKDGISLVQTAEGALTEVHDMLNRMVTLAEKSANGTYDNDVDRYQLQKEVDQLKTEIDRIADSANFNGINLLDGSMESKSAGSQAVSIKGTDRLITSTLGKGEKAYEMAGVKTIFDSTVESAAKGKFQVELSNMGAYGIGSKAGTSTFTVTLQVGDWSMTVVASIANPANGQKITGSLVANAIASAVVGKVSTVTINGVEWTVTKSVGVGLSFEMKSIPLTSQEAKTDFSVGLTIGAISQYENSNNEKTDSLVFNYSNVSGTKTKQKGIAIGDANRANTVFNIKADDIVDGARITLGTKTLVLKVGADSRTEVKDSTKETLVDLKNLDPDDIDLDYALSKISSACQSFHVKYNYVDANGKMAQAIATFSLAVSDNSNGKAVGLSIQRVTPIGTAAGQFPAYFTSLDKLGGIFSMTYTKSWDAQKGLTLQIGDTSDKFNQLEVSINDCHSEAIGIGDVNISTQEGAQAAVDKIKAAINYVSDVRGTLGATQNRLDHTMNNLSVMQENIQDAESTIRDVDVAKEMMEYTKNSILIQSAQAMLAQANQLPQGVLQLLG